MLFGLTLVAPKLQHIDTAAPAEYNQLDIVFFGWSVLSFSFQKLYEQDSHTPNMSTAVQSNSVEWLRRKALEPNRLCCNPSFVALPHRVLIRVN